MAEIAPDPPGWLTALRFDIDTEGGGAAWIEAELPAPNLVVVNPRNGHAHLIYLLGAWVRTDFGDPNRLKVVRYAAAIERAYATALGADPAYSGRFHHNPLSAAYVTKVGRDAPYSLAELAQYVDLTPPAIKPVPIGIGRNVEVFDRLRRWAYTAIADWKIGTHDAWHDAVAQRAAQLAADVGAASPRGPLKGNEIGHIAKSVARWVWERYVVGVPPLLREAQIAARRQRERERQKAREAARERSRMTRAEYTATARQRRSQAMELRRWGLSLRAIAAALQCSSAEIYRLLSARVQGSPGLSDFKGAEVPATRGDVSDRNGDPFASKLSAGNGGAIAAAIVSEYAAGAHSAQFEKGVKGEGRGVRGETVTAQSVISSIQPMRYELGTWFERWKDDHVLANRRILELDAKREAPAKTLARYFVQRRREAERTGRVVRRVKDLFAETATELKRGKNPQRLRDWLEGTLRTLKNDRIIADWSYVEPIDNLPRYKWLEPWLEYHIAVSFA
jgi:hypothetical protein